MATSKKLTGRKSLYFPLGENFNWRRRACQKDPKNFLESVGREASPSFQMPLLLDPLTESIHLWMVLSRIVSSFDLCKYFTQIKFSPDLLR